MAQEEVDALTDETAAADVVVSVGAVYAIAELLGAVVIERSSMYLAVWARFLGVGRYVVVVAKVLDVRLLEVGGVVANTSGYCERAVEE